VNIAKKIQSNLKKFVPTALKKRFGHAPGGVGFRPGARVLVTDEDGDKVLATVIEHLGDTVCVKFPDGEIEGVHAAEVRRAPRRRRASAPAPVGPVESEPDKFSVG